MFRVYLFVLVCVFTFSAQAQHKKKVLIIGIDGCRPDALLKAHTPHIDTLIGNATYSFDALTKVPTLSAAGWSSILTGVWGDKHGATDHNHFGHTHYDTYPDIFKYIEDYNPELKTASLVVWAPINDKIVSHADVESKFDNDSTMAYAVANRIANEEIDVMFIHFDDVDHAGHQYGFHPSIQAYIQAIESTDILIGNILESMHKRPDFNNEDWLIMITPDHGGTIKGSHGGSSFEERRIFFIASGNTIKNRKIEKGYNTSTQTYDFSNTPKIVDIPATVLDYLGISIPTYFDGKSKL